MAFLTSESPNVQIREVDLSGVVPAVTSSTGALVGDFGWGPVDQPILIGNEAQLVNTFGSPDLLDSATAPIDFLSATQFLRYSGSLQTIRATDGTAKNAASGSFTTGQEPTVKNLEDWNVQEAGFAAGDSVDFVAKYPGSVGSSIAVSICGARDSAWDDWAYKSSFNTQPGTSTYVANRSVDSAGAKDEVHIAVVDSDGLITGTRGTVLETFENLSIATDALAEDGTTNFVLEVLNNRSSYVWAANVPSAYTPTNASSFTNSTNGTDASTLTAAEVSRLRGGANSGTLDQGDYTTGFTQVEDENTIQVDFLIAPSVAEASNQRTLVNDLVAKATARKDCIVVASPARESVVGITNPQTINDNIINWSESGVSGSSYLVLDNNFVKVYDKYADKYRFVPAASSTAGIMASTDQLAAPWFSPAGSRRGSYLGVASLSYTANKAQRDLLYKAGVNPIINLPGQGILLYGDKTFLNKSSAFNRINVRRLFLVMERAIKGAAQNVLFEFNDEFTRAEFVNIVEPFLREIKGRRGITDFRVVCDETNNTPDIIDNNSFVASVFVKPARSINYVQLNFVAVRTGVDFDEVVGIV